MGKGNAAGDAQIIASGSLIKLERKQLHAASNKI